MQNHSDTAEQEVYCQENFSEGQMRELEYRFETTTQLQENEAALARVSDVYHQRNAMNIQIDYTILYKEIKTNSDKKSLQLIQDYAEKGHMVA